MTDDFSPPPLSPYTRALFGDLSDNTPKGTIVRLKSGGPPMTVEHGKDTLECAWFTRRGKLRRGRFPREMLVERVAPEGIPSSPS